MKKILILALHLGIGGVENAIISLANSLSVEYDIEIVSVYKMLDFPVFPINNKVKVTYLTNLKPNKQKLINSIQQKKILSTIKEGIQAVKILYLRKHEMKSYLKNADADIIISTRILYNKMLGKHKNNNVIKMTQEHRYHQNDKKYIQKLKKSCKNIDYFLPVSQYLTNYYTKIFNDMQVKVLYGPIGIYYFPIQLSSLKNKHLISIGRVSPEKGFLDLIDVFAKIVKQDPQYVLSIVGDGEQMNEIKEKIKNLHLENQIILHGFLNPDDIHQLLIDCSIYVMTSYEESFGLTLVEAMAFGIPCIAFDSAIGAQEIIDNSCGILIKNRSFDQMANSIIQLFENKNKLIAMGIKARKKSEQYSFKNIQKKWLEIINQVIKNK